MRDDTSRESHLGTLRSEFDDDGSVLHPGFETLSTLVSSVRAAFMSFRIGPEQAAELCRDLRLTSTDGYEWTMGATSGAWFRRKVGERSWIKSAMPLSVTPVDSGPVWLQEGIGHRLLAAEQATSAKQEVVVAESAGRDTHAALNPFQSTDTSSVPESQSTATFERGEPRASAVRSSASNYDWLLDEWETADRTRRDTLPGTLPASVRSDDALSSLLTETVGPVDRDGASQGAEAPVERGGINPEDFFLKPDE